MKKMEKIVLIFLLMSFSLMGVGGDFGSGGGVSTIRQLTLDQIKLKKHKIDYYFFIDELSKITYLRERENQQAQEIKDRAKARARTEVLPSDYERRLFFIEKQLVPSMSFNSLYLSDIIAVTSINRGVFELSDVYTVHIRTDIDVNDGHRIEHIIAFELLDSSIVMMDEIIGLEILPRITLE